MNPSEASQLNRPRDRWNDVCGASAIVAFFLIVGYVAGPALLGWKLPYSGGGAAVLGMGATTCLALKTRPTRLAAAVALVGLSMLRTLSGVRPDILIARHGELSLEDCAGLAVLVVAACSILWAAWLGSPSGSDKTQPSTSAGC